MAQNRAQKVTRASTSHSETRLSSSRAYLAWAICSLFFLYQYILRVAPGVMIDELRTDFHLTAAQFATLGAYYLYAYSFLQVPLGALVDRLGIRFMIFTSLALCMGGTYLFAMSNGLWPAQMSRIMVGAGSATAFMCSVKIAADYFSAGRRGMLMGFSLTLGTVGAMTAGKPLVWLVDLVGWRDALNVAAALGAPLIILALIFLPGKSIRVVQHAKLPFPEVAKNFWKKVTDILGNRMILIYTLLAVGLYTPLSALADLWGTTFLMQKFALPRAEAAHTGMMMYGGMALGSLFMPWYFEKKNRVNFGIRLCGFFLLGLMTLILYGPSMGLALTTGTLLLLGVFCGGEMLCFNGVANYTTPENSGLTIGIANTFNMLGGALLQQLIGVGLDWQWDGLVNEDNIRLYSTEQFVLALSCLLIIIALCVFISFFLKEKKR